MEKNVVSLLKELRAYALQKGLQAAIFTMRKIAT